MNRALRTSRERVLRSTASGTAVYLRLHTCSAITGSECSPAAATTASTSHASLSVWDSPRFEDPVPEELFNQCASYSAKSNAANLWPSPSTGHGDPVMLPSPDQSTWRATPALPFFASSSRQNARGF